MYEKKAHTPKRKRVRVEITLNFKQKLREKHRATNINNFIFAVPFSQGEGGGEDSI